MKDFSHLLQFYQEARNVKVQKCQKDTFHVVPSPPLSCWHAKEQKFPKTYCKVSGLNFQIKESSKYLYRGFLKLNCNEPGRFHTRTSHPAIHMMLMWENTSMTTSQNSCEHFDKLSEHLVMSQQESLYPTDTANTFQISRSWKSICFGILLTNKFS